MDSLEDKPVGYRINILVSRLCFRGIYFPQMGSMAWLKVIAQNRRTIFKIVKDGFADWLAANTKSRVRPSVADSVGD